MKHQGFGGCLGASSEPLQTLVSQVSPLQLLFFFFLMVEDDGLVLAPGRVTLLSLGSLCTRDGEGPFDQLDACQDHLLGK